MYAAAIPFPAIDPVLIEIGPLAIRWYALAYIAGLVLGWRYVVRLMRREDLWGRRGAPATADDIDDLLTWVALGVILGGRLGYVLFYNPGYYLANPLQIPVLWEGGMSFHGGFLGVILAIFGFARKRGIPLFPLGDSIAAAAPIGLFFGRIANFINAELYGRATDVPWAVLFPVAPDGRLEARHPSQLYEAALEGLLLFLVLRFLTHRREALERPGLVTGVFLIGYGLSRIVVETVREPDAHIGYLVPLGWTGVTMGMVLSLPMVLIGLWFALRAPRQA
ncbi:prolipoprotein diacylglyceryl transferase [Futiania mangrovi]|uniref:Phosphatidylglycerol--prolipoprotein diacylglyceryl transferase n=1 Tax=Futiania mangrovi TaxID=2959716 RepID=A0A9J6PG69_9PROT|nr:prolipoprotein diacylglyceryl transferase [Futiania mangrovii]MCP1337478.1 prolipoprotein diacylglyceryl transferase [Futiania mangrovii]